MDRIIAGGHGVELKLALIVREGFAFPIRLLCLQLKMSAGNWAMLRIVNDAANSAKNAGECGTNGTSSYK